MTGLVVSAFGGLLPPSGLLEVAAIVAVSLLVGLAARMAVMVAGEWRVAPSPVPVRSDARPQGRSSAAVAVSLVLVTAAVRLLILPLSLYRDAGTGPFAGLLPGLVQVPFLTVIYRVCTVSVIAGNPNLVLSANLFGAPLSQHGLAILTTAGPLPTLVFAAVVTLLITVAAWSSSLAVARLDAAAPASARVVARVVPFGTAAAALVVPFAVSLYLLTSTAWATAERAVLPVDAT